MPTYGHRFMPGSNHATRQWLLQMRYVRNKVIASFEEERQGVSTSK